MMSFCKKCGQEIGPSERFCGNCGTGVVDVRNLNNNSNEVRTVSNSNFSIYINEILEVAKGMLRKPVSTIVSCDEKLKRESSGMLVLVLAILFGLSNMWTVKKITSDVGTLVTGSIGSSFGLNGMFSETINASVPYSKIFIQTGFLFIIGMIILFASNYLIGKYIFKSSVKPLTIVNVISCSAIPFIVALFLRIILSYISSTLGVAVLFIGIIVAIISLFRGITKVLNISEEITIFIIPISCLAMVWVQYIIVGKMLTNILMM
jgi:hypothetical protein